MKQKMIASMVALGFGLVIATASACPGDKKAGKAPCGSKTAKTVADKMDDGRSAPTDTVKKGGCSKPCGKSGATTVADKAPCHGTTATTVADKAPCGHDCDKPCCKKNATTVADKAPCHGKTTTTVADKAPCHGASATTVADKTPCGPDCDKPCCKKDAKTVAKKGGCGKGCGKGCGNKTATTAAADAPCHGAAATTVAAKAPCHGTTTTAVADKAPCHGASATTVADKTPCGPDCDKPCCKKDAKTVAKKGGCGKGCGKSSTTTAAKTGGCGQNRTAIARTSPISPVSQRVQAVLASMPTMKYRVGTETTGCVETAAAMAEKAGTKLEYVVGEETTSDQGEAIARLAAMIEKEAETLQTMQFVAGGKASLCPMTAKTLAKETDSPITYRIGGTDFETKEHAERAAQRIQTTLASLKMEYKVDGKVYGCSKTAGAKCKESGAMMTYVIGDEETRCEKTAQLKLAEAKVRAIAEAAATESLAL